jgi:hypothetical protein
MWTIAGGILLGGLLIATIGLWLPLLIWLIVIGLAIAALFFVGTLITSFPQESLIIGLIITGLIVMTYLDSWWGDNRRKRKKSIQNEIKEELAPNPPGLNRKRFIDLDDKIEGTSLLEKIEQVKDKEVARIKIENEKAEKKKQEKEELLKERFSKINQALQKMMHTYSNKDVSIFQYNDYEACITLHNQPPENITVSAETDESFCIEDGHQIVNFDWSEEVVEYLIERIGKFLAKKEFN